MASNSEKSTVSSTASSLRSCREGVDGTTLCHLSVHLSVCLSVYLHLSTHGSIYLSVHPPIRFVSLCQSVPSLLTPTHLEDGVVWVLDGQPVEHGQGDIGDDWLLQGDSRDAPTNGGRGRDWRAQRNTSVEGGREGRDKIRHSQIVD